VGPGPGADVPARGDADPLTRLLLAAGDATRAHDAVLAVRDLCTDRDGRPFFARHTATGMARVSVQALDTARAEIVRACAAMGLDLEGGKNAL